jgi:ethanolamine ammonia-lyase small subunit
MALGNEIEAIGLPRLIYESAARDRTEYLRRPDLGRRLSADSEQYLPFAGGPFDVVFIVGDGLSPQAVQTQAAPLLHLVTSRLDRASWNIAPVIIVQQARVAIGDEIGATVRASLAVMLIGERPGLSASDSMGVYLTWAPQLGRTDAERNCISNIRPDGLSIGAATELLLLLMHAARARCLSGVELKVAVPGRIETSGSY